MSLSMPMRRPVFVTVVNFPGSPTTAGVTALPSLPPLTAARKVYDPYIDFVLEVRRIHGVEDFPQDNERIIKEQEGMVTDALEKNRAAGEC